MAANRAEYERATAAAYGHTVPEMRSRGYYSAKDNTPGAGGWQTFGIPPGSTRRETEAFLAKFKTPDDLEPKPYGGGGQ